MLAGNNQPWFEDLQAVLNGIHLQDLSCSDALDRLRMSSPAKQDCQVRIKKDGIKDPADFMSLCISGRSGICHMVTATSLSRPTRLLGQIVYEVEECLRLSALGFVGQEAWLT